MRSFCGCLAFGQHDSMAKSPAGAHLVRQAQQHPQEPGQVHLAGGELPPSRVVRAVQGRGAVHDQQRVPGNRQPGL